jgi:EmrB/QacA subfamily drug resistance transporter
VSRPRENPPPERLYALKWRIFGVMMIGWAMSLLDVSIVNVTIPELQKDLSTDIATVTWVVNAYNIAFAVLLVTAGRLADQFGRRRLFVIGMVVFTIGSALCATAWSVEWLIVFRVIQGMGAGILAPLGFAMTALAFPPQQRGFGLALIAVVALVSSAFGPVVGGVLVELASWHWIFIVNLPFGVLGIVLALRWWPETWDLRAVGKRVDVLGMVLLGGAVLALTFALVETNPVAGDLALWLSLMQLAVLLGVAFFFSQRRPDAMIPLAIVRNAQFRRGNLAMLLFSAGAIGTLLLLALIFVNLWGYSELEGALALVPVPICGLLVWPLVGRAADTKAPGDIAVPALVLMAVGMIWVSFLPSTADDAWAYIRVLPGLLLIGVGMGIGFPALNVGTMGAVSGQELGLASGILNTARQLGAAIGVALLIATFGGATAGYMELFGKDDIDDLADEWEIPHAMTAGIVGATLHDYAGGTSDRFQPKPGFDQEVIRVTAGAAREGFAWALRHAALLVLSAIPLARSLRRTPQQARAQEAAAAAAAAAPPPPQADGRDGAPRGSPAAPATG